MAMQTYTHKRGDTFSLAGTVLGVSSGATVARAQLRGNTPPYLLVQTLNVTLGPYVDDVTPRALLVEQSTSSTAWPIGTLLCDVEFDEPGGIVVSSPTFAINVVLDVTQ